MKTIEADIAKLKEAVGLACGATYAPNIIKGRESIFSMPREWVLDNIENAAAQILDLSNEWDYRRLLEIYEKLDRTLLQKLIKCGLNSTNEEIIEAATDFNKHIT